MTNTELIAEVHEIAQTLDLRDKNVGYQVAAMIQQSRIMSENKPKAFLDELSNKVDSFLASFMPETTEGAETATTETATNTESGTTITETATNTEADTTTTETATNTESGTTTTEDTNTATNTDTTTTEKE